MADTKISGLTATTAFQGDDEIPASDVTNTSNKKWTVVQIGGIAGVNDQSGATYTIVAADRCKVVRATGTAATTFTTPAAATVQSGWWCYVENALTGTTGASKKLTVDGDASETVDAATTIITYPEDLRILFSDGANWFTKLLKGGYIELASTDSPYTLTIPSEISSGRVELWGGGGGGGSGAVTPSATANSGGGGGGGAGWAGNEIAAATLGSSVTVTLAGAAAGGVGQTVDATAGNAGTTGSNSTFGSLLTAYGGFQGGAGQSAAVSTASSGGGILTAGVTGTTGGGAPTPSDASEQNQGFGGANPAPTGSPVPSAYGGSSGGGGANGGSGTAGGTSFKGGAGGGGGGGKSAGPLWQQGGAGGGGQGAASGGGGAGGATERAVGAAGINDLNGLGRGTGGGGGAGSDDTAGASGVGGAGGTACGGGGSGGQIDGADSSAGGTGGPGLCRFWYS